MTEALRKFVELGPNIKNRHSWNENNGLFINELEAQTLFAALEAVQAILDKPAVGGMADNTGYDFVAARPLSAPPAAVDEVKQKMIAEMQATAKACGDLDTPAEDVRVQLVFSLPNLKRMIKYLEEHNG